MKNNIGRNKIGKNNIRLIVGILFVLSGACGLVYQIVWAKYLGLFIGNTTYAQTIVLATFMGGLMLGSYTIGRFADHTHHHLRMYALLEIGIGLYCLAFPVILPWCESLYLSTATSLALGMGSPSLLSLKLLMSLLLMIVPTFLMGGTLPVLVKFLTRTIDRAGKDVATLYWINSLGAIIGAGLAGFFLIRALGLSSTIVVAAATNLFVGLAALALAARLRAIPEPVPAVAPARRGVESASKKVVVLVLIATGISGLVSMIYELAWVRLLSTILGSSTYSFSLMVVAFISGITAGSFLVSRFIDNVKKPLRLLAFCQVAAGLSMILTLPLYERLPYFFLRMASTFDRTPEGYTLFLAAKFLFCFVIMLVPTVFLGMSFPIASRIASTKLNVLGRTIGNVYAINTLGTVLGATLTGLFLISAIGVKQTIEVGVLLNILVGFMLLLPDKDSPRFKTAMIMSAITVFLAYRLFVPAWDPQIMTAGVFRELHDAPPSSFQEFKRHYQTRQLLYYKEGSHANVGVVRYRNPGGVEKSLIINGKPDASSLTDLATQILLGQVPLLLKPDAMDVLVIGLGSGVTLGSVLTHTVRRVDCVEISPEVVEASRFFTEENGNCLDDPRVQMFVEDAHSFLKLTPDKYDVIISEPSNPWIAGIGNLFSREYFDACSGRLAATGMLVQWFHTYDMDNETFQMVMHTFASSFPHAVMLRPRMGDVLLLGSHSPITVDVAAIRKRMELPAVRHDLERIHVPDIPTLLSLQMTSEQTMRTLGQEGSLNTEDKPLLEYLAPRALFIGSEVTLIRNYDERQLLSDGRLWLDDYARKSPLGAREYVNIALYHMKWTVGDFPLALFFLERASALAPEDANVENLNVMLRRIMQKE
jgi:spermidine synthase